VKNPFQRNRSSDHRIDRAVEHLLSPAEWKALQAEVVKDPKTRAEYVEAVWLHATLQANRDQMRDLVPAPEPRWGGWLLAARIGGMAAVLLGVALCVALLLRRSEPPYVAELVETHNCRWADSDLATAERTKLGAGRLVLVQGIAKLKFRSDAVVTLEAPAALQLLDPMHCRLIEGAAIVEVPQPAHGFTVETCDIHAVDLGTRFAITTGAGGYSQVYVLEGEVTVGKDRTSEPKLLTTGEFQSVRREGESPAGGQLAGSPRAESGLDGWTSVTTSFGRGKDGTLERRGGVPMGNRPLLLVKHTDVKAAWTERCAVLTFDLSGMDVSQVVQAQLLLQPEPSGLGFSSMVPDSTFGVYGVLDAAFNVWDEATITWGTASIVDGSGLIPGKVRRLADFELPRGASSDVVVIQNADLAGFIRNATNQLVTLVVTRDTSETQMHGLVHAFASKEHPTGKPPTLRLQFNPVQQAQKAPPGRQP
jgi:hypothetical protein